MRVSVAHMKDGRPRILLVDGDRETLETLGRWLASERYHVFTAPDIAAAHHVLEHTPPDLLITDVRLDGYNGLHLIAMARTPIPAIVMTGVDDAGIEADARRLGAEFLVKPVAHHVLRAAIRSKLAAPPATPPFVPARRAPRIPLSSPLAVFAGEHRAYLIDVSEDGARLEVEAAVPTGVPQTFTLMRQSASLSVTADVAWTRQRDAQTWICGVMIRPDAHGMWRQLVASLTARA